MYTWWTVIVPFSLDLQQIDTVIAIVHISLDLEQVGSVNAHLMYNRRILSGS